MSIPIQIISAPSILGLKPGGVARLGERLLEAGLAKELGVKLPILRIPDRNEKYSFDRDPETACLNTREIRSFSMELAAVIEQTVSSSIFPLVLGGDCSILIGIMCGLRRLGAYGLAFMDAHADFYLPTQSITGEVADMELAIVTGRGPSLLTNINNLEPYVRDTNVIHLAQRDIAETRKYGSQDIRQTGIRCYPLENFRTNGFNDTLKNALVDIHSMQAQHLWLHFDTDAISDDENPAVDYRLPGGLTFEEAGTILKSLFETNRVVGMSVSIYNPSLDEDASIARKLVQLLSNSIPPTLSLMTLEKLGKNFHI